MEYVSDISSVSFILYYFYNQNTVKGKKIYFDIFYNIFAYFQFQSF